MRVQVDLVGEIGDAESAHVVLDQREGNDEGHEPLPVRLERLAELGALVTAELALEEAGHVLQDVHVPRG